MIHLMDDIPAFIEGKSLSENSQKSYQYDLQQFCQLVDGVLSTSKLKLYEQSLKTLKPAARKRKLSAVNQFLLYLYEKGRVKDFYRIKVRDSRKKEPERVTRLDFSTFYESPDSSGKWIALLILELGLSPSELSLLKLTDLDKEFGVIKVKKGGQVRILSLTESLKPLFDFAGDGVYLFDNKGQTYSRQWFFNQLNAFLDEVGFPDLTAQKLREQYIIREIAAGTDLLDLMKKLGLKTPMTLEHYYRDGY